MAELISIEVPLGRITLAGPCAFSRWSMPVIVVTGLFDGVSFWKYLESLKMECDVPLSRMQVSPWPGGGISSVVVARWVSR
jgi:hypothetical protein